MSKVHITLVGAQLAAVYHGIVATSPDKVICITSSSSKTKLDRLIREIDIPCEEIELSTTDPHAILQTAFVLSKTYENDEVTVNISSGLKSWSHFFGLVFDKCPNASVVYMDQNNVLWNYRDMTSSSDFEFDMMANFRLYGNSLEDNFNRYSDYTESDLACIEKLEMLRIFNHKDFLDLTSVLKPAHEKQLKKQKYGLFTLLNSDSFVEWKKTSLENLGFVRIGLYKNDGQSMEVTLESEHAVEIAFHTHWFELKVARLLSGWDKAKDILMNCRFPFKPLVDKNEVDIIVNTGTKLLFVECKTQIIHNTDIDKFRSVVKGYGGMGSKGIFITDEIMKDVAVTKCSDNELLCYSLKAPHLLDVNKSLYFLLDSELFNINLK